MSEDNSDNYVLEAFQSEDLPPKAAKVAKPFDAVAAMLVRETKVSPAQGEALRHLYKARKAAIKATES